MKKVLSILTLSAVLALGVFAGVGTAGNGKGGGKGSDHVTICHATGTPDNAGNGYVQISPSASGVYHGHYRQHKADIIPPFQYKGTTYSENWDSAHIAIWNNGCKPVASTTTTSSTTIASTSTATTTVASTTTAPARTVTVKQTTTVQSKPKVVVKKVVVVKQAPKKVIYLPAPPKQTKVKPNGFPYTP